jgi:hypothetical protein
MKGQRPLTAAEKAAIAAAKPIEELLVRPTPDAQKELLERLRKGGDQAENVDDTLEEEFDIR